MNYNIFFLNFEWVGIQSNLKIHRNLPWNISIFMTETVGKLYWINLIVFRILSVFLLLQKMKYSSIWRILSPFIISLIWGIIPKVGDTIWAGKILFNSNYLVCQEKEKKSWGEYDSYIENKKKNHKEKKKSTNESWT